MFYVVEQLCMPYSDKWVCMGNAWHRTVQSGSSNTRKKGLKKKRWILHFPIKLKALSCMEHETCNCATYIAMF